MLDLLRVTIVIIRIEHVIRVGILDHVLLLQMRHVCSVSLDFIALATRQDIHVDHTKTPVLVPQKNLIVYVIINQQTMHTLQTQMNVSGNATVIE
jgi:hypothetical protein